MTRLSEGRSVCLIAFRKALLVAPHFEVDHSFGRVGLRGYRSGAMPAALLIELCRPVVADRAREPRGLDAHRREKCFGIGNQRRSNARSRRARRHQALLKLTT